MSVDFNVLGYVTESGKFICAKCVDEYDKGGAFIIVCAGDVGFDRFPMCDICGRVFDDVELSDDGVDFEISLIKKDLEMMVYALHLGVTDDLLEDYTEVGEKIKRLVKYLG